MATMSMHVKWLTIGAGPAESGPRSDNAYLSLAVGLCLSKLYSPGHIEKF